MQLEAVKELEERLEAVKEERSQLKTDLQDNVDMVRKYYTLRYS